MIIVYNVFYPFAITVIVFNMISDKKRTEGVTLCSVSND